MHVPFLFQFHSNQGDNVDYRHGTSLKYSREYSMADGFMGDISFRGDIRAASSVSPVTCPIISIKFTVAF